MANTQNDPAPLERYVIGRSPRSDIVVRNPYVSNTHATLEVHDSGVYVADAESTNGTFVNRLGAPIQRQRVELDDIVYLSDCYKTTARTLLNRGRLGQREPVGKNYVATDAEVLRLGRSQENDLVVDALGVEPFHAEIRRRQGKRVLVDLGTRVGTYVNGRLLRGDERDIKPEDVIEIAGYTIRLLFDEADSHLSAGVEREGIFVHGKALTLEVPDDAKGGRKAILDRVSVVVQPGEFVGLMGPSGCGKTTLMTVLSGANSPTIGEVLYNGVALGTQYERLRSQIGYVPQDDIMHAELTVREVLYYNAKMRLPPNVTDQEIDAKIDSICQDLGLYQPGGLDLRSTVVGSPEKKTLSGGQKKRVNLAIELLTDPKVLFLDEPTSGLSSKDTVVVMQILRRLAIEKAIAIVITIHQPSLKVYKLLDKIIYLKSGKLCYFGNAFPDSITFFERQERPDVAGPDAVMEKLDDCDAEACRQAFLQTPNQAWINRRLSDAPKENSQPRGFAAQEMSQQAGALSQLALLVKRYFLCKTRDRSALAIAIGQAPLIAVLLALAFYENSINMPLFLLVFISLWFGTNNSAKEVVGEKSIFQRERRSALRVGPYLLAKFLVQGLLTLIQCTLLVVISAGLLQLQFNLLAGVGICWAASLVGVAIGLALSCLAKTEVSAIVLVPLVLIPFILFGGLLKRYDDMGTATRMIANLTPSRWGYELMVMAEDHSDREVRSWERTNVSGQSVPSAYALARFSSDYERSSERVAICLGVLSLFGVGSLGLGLARLNRT